MTDFSLQQNNAIYRITTACEKLNLSTAAALKIFAAASYAYRKGCAFTIERIAEQLVAAIKAQLSKGFEARLAYVDYMGFWAPANAYQEWGVDFSDYEKGGAWLVVNPYGFSHYSEHVAEN